MVFGRAVLHDAFSIIRYDVCLALHYCPRDFRIFLLRKKKTIKEKKNSIYNLPFEYFPYTNRRTLKNIFLHVYWIYVYTHTHIRISNTRAIVNIQLKWNGWKKKQKNHHISLLFSHIRIFARHTVHTTPQRDYVIPLSFSKHRSVCFISVLS